MLGHGDDAGHCSNGASGWNYRGASAADRATFRRWLRGVIVFYVGVLTVVGAVAFTSNNDVAATQIADILAQVTASPLGPDDGGSVAPRPPARTKTAWW